MLPLLPHQQPPIQYPTPKNPEESKNPEEFLKSGILRMAPDRAAVHWRFSGNIG